MSRRLGLIIGANDYQDSMFRSLHFAENDARALAQWLVNTRGGKWAPGNVQHVQGSHATKELIESLITRMCVNIAEPDDFALIYFAGHAFIDERTGDGLLALSNTNHQDSTTALHLPSLAQRIFSQSRAAHILFILDCFQNSQTWDLRRSSSYDSKPLIGPQLLNALQSNANRLFLCSCRGSATAPESGERQLGYFVHQTILGLCGAAGNQGTSAITLHQLHNYLFEALGEQQRPQLFGRDQPPLLLIGDTQPAPGNAQFSATPSVSMQTGSGMPVQSPARPATGTPFPHTEDPAYTTLTAQPQRETTGQLGLLQNAAVNQHRQQRYTTMINQAQQMLLNQRYPEAFTAVEQALILIPNDIPALILKGQILGNGGRSQEAFATVAQILQLDPNNAMAWSMRAVLLSNTNQYDPALEAIEHAINADSKNLEFYTIKNNIMTQLAMLRSQAGDQQTRLEAPQDAPRPRGSILVALLIRIAYLVLGSVGAGLLFLQSRITPFPGLVLITLGLLFLCTNAASTIKRFGFTFIIPTLITSVLLAGALGATYKVGYNRVIALLAAHPTFMMPMIGLLVWLAAAAILPIIFAFGGLISRAFTRKA